MVSRSSLGVCLLLSVFSVGCGERREDAVIEVGEGDSGVARDGSDQWSEAADGGDSGSGVPSSPLPAREVIAFGVGQELVCALLRDQTIRCWGSDYYGQLGRPQGTPLELTPSGDHVVIPPVDLGKDRVPVHVAVGWSHACAVLDDGAAKCWGQNRVAQLGLGDANSRGDDEGEMGDDLPAIDLGSGVLVADLQAGAGHTCALLSDGRVKCWGKVFLPSRAPDQEIGDQPGDMGDNLPAVDLSTDARPIILAVGPSESCVVLNDNAVKCWTVIPGAEDELPAVPLDAGVVRSIAVGEGHVCAAFEDGLVRCWGNDSYGQLGSGPRCADGDLECNRPPAVVGGLSGVRRVAAGRFSSCALRDNGSVRCWGDRSDAPFDAVEEEQASGAIFVDPIGADLSAVAIDSNDWSTCVLLDDDRISCWGGALGSKCFQVTPTSFAASHGTCAAL